MIIGFTILVWLDVPFSLSCLEIIISPTQSLYLEVHIISDCGV